MEFCKTCEGSGTVDIDWHIIADCPDCDGTGEQQHVTTKQKKMTRGNGSQHFASYELILAHRGRMCKCYKLHH